MCTDSRFTKPRISLRGVRVVTFCVVQKVTKKHVLGRAKSCQWQVFVRRRPPKQGELRTDVSKATMFQGVDSVLRPAIQSSIEVDFSRVFRRHEPKPVFRAKRRRKGFESVRRSGVTARGFRAEIKRTALFFADSRLWLGANLRCLWWKRVVWDGNKERLVQTESVWFAKKCCF